MFRTIFICFYLILAILVTHREELKYSPTACTITNYKFTFIFDDNQEVYKVHGIWPEQCVECPTCGYPSCCNVDKIIYSDPYDPSNFIVNNWYATTTKEECTHKSNVTLFEHEYYKHISCTNMTNTTVFLNKTIELYDKYYNKYVNNKCIGYSEIWLSLDENYNYISSECK